MVPSCRLTVVNVHTDITTHHLHSYMYTIHMNIVVGVLRGGPSRKYNKSLETGNAMLSHLSRDRYVPRDIFIDKKGMWHVAGKPVSPTRVLDMVDVVLVGLHGEYAQDGEIQKILERHGVPYSGSNSFASFLSAHKVFAKKYAGENNIRTPRYVLIESSDDITNSAIASVQSFIPPVVVKPVKLDSSVWAFFATGYPEVKKIASMLFNESAQGVILEEYIRGHIVKVGVVEHFRGKELYTLPPAEIITPINKDFSSFNTKTEDNTKSISCPAVLSKAQKEEMERDAVTIHRVLGLRHYSVSDFIITPHGVYYVKTNSLPELTQGSVFATMLESVGVKSPDFTEHLINLALRKV